MNARVQSDVAAVTKDRTFAMSALDLARLTKPRITVMVLLTALGGMALAVRTGASQGLDMVSSAASLLGICLIVSSANALNMYIEREGDALMTRTADRPLPSGRMEPMVALWFGVLLASLAFPLLAIMAGWQTSALAMLAWVIYVFAYTPLKRTTSTALIVGAVPGAMPPLLGWTAATGEVALPGLALFGVLFFWQIPHFVAIATFRREEYDRAGIKVLPSEKGDRVARLHAVGYLVALLVVSLAMVPLGIAGTGYLVATSVIGAAFFATCLMGLRPHVLQVKEAGIRWARQLFAVSLIYLPAWVAAIMFGA
jgi:heme o synthase